MPVPAGRASTGSGAIPIYAGLTVVTAVAYVLTVWARARGLVFGSPWAVSGMVGLYGLAGTQRWQRLLGGGALHNRLMLRLLLAMGFGAVLLGYCGWGFMLPALAVLVGVVHMGWSGARSWRTTAIVVAAATVATQGALHLGLVPSILPAGLSDLLAVWNLILAVFGLSNLGRSAADAEGVHEELRRTEARFRAMIEKSSDVITVLDADGCLTEVSPGMRHVTGWDPAELVGTNRLRLVHPDDQSRARAAVEELVRSGNGHEARLEFRSQHRDGSWRWHEVTMRNLLADPDVRGIVSNERDISERRLHQESLAHTAAHDGLTGLPNRPEILRLLIEAGPAVRPGRLLAVLFIDLDGFKTVNDTHGHRVGDDLLIAVAQRLRQELRPADVLGRFGGDEFVAVLRDVVDPRTVQVCAEHLMAVMRQPFQLACGTVRIGASIGTAATDDPTMDTAALVDRADARMYTVKRGTAAGVLAGQERLSG